MRRRLIIGAVAALMVAASGVFVASRGGDDRNADGLTAPGLDARTVNAGEIEIKIQPRQLDAQGAVFGVVLDTHSTELRLDGFGEPVEVDWQAIGAVQNPDTGAAR